MGCGRPKVSFHYKPSVVSLKVQSLKPAWRITSCLLAGTSWLTVRWQIILQKLKYSPLSSTFLAMFCVSIALIFYMNTFCQTS